MKISIKITLITIITAAVLSLLNFIYKIGYEKIYWNHNEQFDELTKNKPNYDIIYLGTSRTYVHNNPRVIDSITGLSSYNFGIVGANLLEMNMWLELYLQNHHRPKLVVLELYLNAFNIEKKPFFDHTIYLPSINNPIIYNTLSEYRSVWIYKYVPFMELVEYDDYKKFTAFKSAFHGTEQTKHDLIYKGYLENRNKNASLDKLKANDELFTSNESGAKILNQLITTCKSSNIKLMITYAPEFFMANHTNTKTFFYYIAKVCAQQKLTFVDYRNSDICLDEKLFVDAEHLNKTGATKFSIILANDILKELKK